MLTTLDEGLTTAERILKEKTGRNKKMFVYNIDLLEKFAAPRFFSSRYMKKKKKKKKKKVYVPILITQEMDIFLCRESSPVLYLEITHSARNEIPLTPCPSGGRKCPDNPKGLFVYSHLQFFSYYLPLVCL